MNFNYLLVCLSVSFLSLVTSCKQSAPNTENSDTSTSPEEYTLYVEGKHHTGISYSSTTLGNMNDMQLEIQTQGQTINGVMNRADHKLKITTIDSDMQHTIFYKRKDAVSDESFNGRKSPTKTKTHPLDKKTVIMTKDSTGLWQASLKGGLMTDEIQEELDSEAVSYNAPEDKYMYGTEPREIGDIWQVDASLMPSFAGGNIDNITGSFNVKFDSIRKNQGLDCAVLIFDFHLLGETENGLEMKMLGKAEVLRSLKYHTDVNVSLQGTISANGNLPQGSGKVEMSGPIMMTNKVDIKIP